MLFNSNATMVIKKVFVPEPEMCYFYKGKWVERGYNKYVDDGTIEDRMLDLELQFRELNSLLIDIWGHYQPEMSDEMRESLGKIMKLCRDYSEEIG
jgi:hypothetical protein